MKGISIEDLFVGIEASLTRQITESDVRQFGELTGDLNPAHFDDEFASQTIFKKRIAHGCLCSSIFSTLLGMELPGPGTIYLKQEVKFIKPVYINDVVKATIKVLEVDREKNRVLFSMNMHNQADELVLAGTSLVMPPKK